MAALLASIIRVVMALSLSQAAVAAAAGRPAAAAPGLPERRGATVDEGEHPGREEADEASPLILVQIGSSSCVFLGSDK